jgi:hypothetical protein
MTDYKNELEQAREVLVELTDCPDVFLDETMATPVCLKCLDRVDEALAKLEALLSQHSKKRELEARRDELQALNRDIFGDLVTSREIKNTITKRLGRIHKLTNGEGK